MRILVLGDVMGKPGRSCVMKHLAQVIEENKVEFVIADVDNAAHGMGVNESIVKDFLNLGVDVMTGGNHIVDKMEIFHFLGASDKLLKPINFNSRLPGKGFSVYHLSDNRKILVIHAMGQTFMSPILNNPFLMIDEVLNTYKLKRNVDAIVLDFHAEVTSEKYAMGHFLDGRVSCVVGTHTHVPTADAHILEKGTAFISDIGMNGDYDSVIGFDKGIITENFLRQFGFSKKEPAKQEATFCAVFVETDENTGLATLIRHIKIGGALERCKL